MSVCPGCGRCNQCGHPAPVPQHPCGPYTAPWPSVPAGPTWVFPNTVPHLYPTYTITC